MYFGDNLRDFSEDFAAERLPKDASAGARLSAIQNRKDKVDEAAAHWGVDWFVLPNPTYGEWEKLIGPNPDAILRAADLKTNP